MYKACEARLCQLAAFSPLHYPFCSLIDTTRAPDICLVLLKTANQALKLFDQLGGKWKNVVIALNCGCSVSKP